MLYVRQNLIRSFVRVTLMVSIAASSFNTIAHADATGEEINSLISAVAESGCTFVRNGKSYNAQEAKEHLQLKYRRGRKYATTAEQFVSRLASKSSMSGKPYYMKCAGEPLRRTSSPGATLVFAAPRVLRSSDCSGQSPTKE